MIASISAICETRTHSSRQVQHQTLGEHLLPGVICQRSADNFTQIKFWQKPIGSEGVSAERDSLYGPGVKR